MRVLAFDTSNSGFSLVLIDDQKVLSKTIIEENGKQAELLVPTIENALRQNNIWYDDLDLIAAIQGPGSFTGVRIGLSVARTLKIATNLPLILINSLEALNFPNRNYEGEVFAVIDAGMDEFFIATFQQKEIITEPQLATFDNLSNFLPKNNFLICGSGQKIASEIAAQKKLNFKIASNIAIDPVDIALLALQKYQASNSTQQNHQPVYLRGPRITQRKK